MRKIEITEEEILLVKQAICDYRDKLVSENGRYSKPEIELAESILKRIREELNRNV